MTDPIATLISAARALGSSVLRAEVALYRHGGIAVRIQVETDDDVRAVGTALGCRMPPELQGIDGREWMCAERGVLGDDLMVSVVGGHREVCLCPAAVAARKGG